MKNITDTIQGGGGAYSFLLAAIIAFASAFAAYATSLKWDGGGDGVNFSHPLNWEGDVAPAAGSDSYRLEFNGAANGKSLVNDIVGLSVTNVTFGQNATSPVTISGEALTDCVKIQNYSTNSTHHIFKCEVVCKSGTTPDISNSSGNYVKFIGGLKTYSLAFPANLSSNSAYYMGDIEVLTTDYLWNGTKYASGQKTINNLTTRVIIVSGSNVRIPNACLNWVQIENGATVTVNNLTTSLRFYGDNNSNRYMQNYKSWYAYWTRAADACNGTLRVLNGLSFAGQDCFMPDASSADSIVIMKGIKNSSTQSTSGAYKGVPYVYLNQGNRVPKSSNAYGTTTHTGEGRIVLGSGGLQVVSGANSAARFVVGYDSTLCSYENWAIAAHPTSGNVALAIESSKTLTIDTGHYAVGDPEIDDGATAHTVTVNGVIGGSGHLLAAGAGKVVFNSVCTHTGGTKVTGEVVLKTGSRPGASTLSVWGGGKLTLPDRGTVTLGSNIVVGDKTNLRFTINDSTDTNKLVVSGVTDTIDAADKFVNVYVDAPGGQFLRGFTPYTLITVTGNTKLTTEDLSKYKLQDKPTWASRLDVVDGNLVLWPCAPGLSFSIR